MPGACPKARSIADAPIAPVAAFPYSGMTAVLRRTLALVWAAPCTALGLLLALPLVLAGGRVRRVGHVLEVSCGPPGHGVLHRRIARTRWSAITLGHVVIGGSRSELDRLRAHELQHVRQYEAWGPLFLVAYPAASLAALLRGAHPYVDNGFERQARAAEQVARDKPQTRVDTTR